MDSNSTYQRPLAFTCLILFAFCFACMGEWRPFFFDIDEPKYITAAMEMARSGDWLHPMFGGLPRMQKPPLPYWLTAAVIDFFGTGFSTGTQLFIARIPAILGSAMTVAATYLIGRRLGGEKCGLFAGLLLAVAPPFKIEGMLLKADIIYTAAVTWSSFFYLRRLQGQRGLLNLSGASIALGLGVLSKGPFALPPLAGYLLAEIFRNKSRRTIPFYRAIPETLKKEAAPVLLALMACLPFILWLAAASSSGMDYLSGMLNDVSQNTTYKTPVLLHHLQSIGFYLYETGIVFFPLGIFGLCAIYFLLRYKEDRTGDTIYLLWSGLFYLLLNMFVFRLRAHRYFLPLMPILSIIAVNWILTAKREGLFKKIFYACTVLVALIPTVIGVIVLYSGQISVNLWRNAQISDFQTQAIPFAIATFALSITIGLAGLKLYKKPAKFLAIAFGGMLLFYPFYFNATPDVDTNGQLKPDTLLAKNMANTIDRSIAAQDNYIFIASRRSLRIHPELHFFLHNTINRKGKRYLTTLPFQTHNFTRILIDPASASSILRTEKNGNIQTPLYDFLNTNKFEKTALILNNIEVSLLYRSLPSLNTFKSKTEFVAVKGLGHEWKNEILYLVTLKDN
ncbi:MULTISPECIES: ArnT family glycosyltransferase [unclassified Maridesulfovibrio]|uniref:ArnT family glycosyltransferase n=1 Tax=unclassified Maridesulfovibrio TaxID=2794999 RepID=UPI003B3F5CAA